MARFAWFTLVSEVFISVQPMITEMYEVNMEKYALLSESQLKDCFAKNVELDNCNFLFVLPC